MLEHALQHIKVGLDRDLGEEVTADERHALVHAMGLQELLGADDGLGQVEQDAVHLGMRFQDRGEQSAVTAADVGDAADAGEIQRRDDGARPGEGLAGEIGGEGVAAA